MTNETKTKDDTDNVIDYKYLIDGLLDVAIYALSEHGLVKSWNKASERLMGYQEKEVLGKHFSMFYSQEDRDRKYADFELSEADRIGKFEGTGWRIKKDGSPIFVDVLIAAVRDGDGPAKGYVKVVRDATARKKAEDIIERQKKDLIELSTPVIRLWPGVIALPIIGTLDTTRSQIILERLLNALSTSGSAVAILDISGVPNVDTVIAQRLMKTVDAARLMGAECIISGVRPEIAQTMVHLGVDLSMVKTKATMARALEEALGMLKLAVVSTNRERHRSE